MQRRDTKTDINRQTTRECQTIDAQNDQTHKQSQTEDTINNPFVVSTHCLWHLSEKYD